MASTWSASLVSSVNWTWSAAAKETEDEVRSAMRRGEDDHQPNTHETLPLFDGTGTQEVSTILLCASQKSSLLCL